MKRTGMLVLSAAAFAFAAGSASAMDCSYGMAHMKKSSDAVAEAPKMTPLPTNNEIAMSAPDYDATDARLFLLRETSTIQ